MTKKVLNHKGLVLLVLVVALALIAACSPTAAPPAAQPTTGAAPAATTAPAQATAAPSGEQMTVGLSFSDFATERWKNEETLMRGLLEAKGYQVLSQEANHDVKLQNDQIDNMVAQGADAIIVIAEDGDAAATAVSNAAAKGVKVLAYDRLIKSPDIAAYLSFNNEEVGRQQADGVMKAIDAANWDTASKGKIRLIKLGGSPTDNNAILFRKGQDETLETYADKIEIVGDQFVDNWDPANALKIMENLLTATQNGVDAVVASNDGTALGALQAMRAQQLAGKVPISGQDATADGCNSIAKGELTVTILKDIRNLSPLAVDTVDKLLKGETVEGLNEYTMAELTNDTTKTGNVKALFLPVQQVDKSNVYDLCVANGFQSYDDVFRDIPEDQRPPRPTSTGATASNSGEGKTIGLSFSDFATERWKNEETLMRQLLEAKGYKVLSQEANHDVKLQNDQIDNMVAQGATGIIVIAEDGDAAATAVSNAAAKGVKVLAYDRLIKSPDIAAYLSFNNEEVGRQQADGVMKAIDAANWDTASKGKIRLIKLGGSPTDNNAILFRKGQDETLETYADKIEIVGDQFVDNWDPANALKIMENLLTATQNGVDAVVASNDGTALGALQAMRAQQLAGKVPISGQDATADGCNSIAKGELTVTILKDIRNLSPLAVDTIDKLVNDQPVEGLNEYTMAELTNDTTKTGNVKALFLPVQQVDKSNVFDLCVKNGFQSYDDVFRDVPESERPPRP